MTAVLNLILSVLAGASLLAAIIYAWRGFSARSRRTRAAYGVGQQEARLTMQRDIARAVAAGFVGLILLGVYGLSARPADPVPTPTLPPKTAVPPTPTSRPELPSATATLPPPVQKTPISNPTATSPVATFTPTPVPTETSTPAPRTAVVNTGVGVWLRAAPGTDGEQVEWVLDGTILTLLAGTETADDLVWQQARTPGGNEGWVAVDYLEISQQ